MGCLCFGKKTKDDSQSIRTSSVLAPSLASILPKLELEWEKLQTLEPSGAVGITAAGLLEAWRRADGARWRQDDAELIAAELGRIFLMIDVDGNGRISLAEFKHFVLLKASLPLQTQYLVDLVQRRAKTDRKFVERLVHDFTETDKLMTGKISLADFQKIIHRQTEANPAFAAAAGFDFSAAADDDSEDSHISYPAYMGLMLGRKPEKVTLLFYDISGRATKVFGRLLFGKKIEGIWHTSILAFGREWWYGGDIFRSTPFKTPFGEPVKRVDINVTYFTHQELFRYITDNLHVKFNQKSYDVFENNCNNFSDTLSVFLCGQHIPQAILDMPRDLLAGGIARLFRRPLNRWLGCFGDNEAAKSDDDALEAVLKALAGERKLFRWKQQTVEVVQKSAKDKEGKDPALVDIRYMQDGEFVDVKDVKISELTEIDQLVDQDFVYLAGTAIDDAELRKDVAKSGVHFNSEPLVSAVPEGDISPDRRASHRKSTWLSGDLFKILFRDGKVQKKKPVKRKCCSCS